MSGTGSPEGVVTAPVGSQWIDTAATTGAIQWVKATGTGNTGWVVQYGDTGTRNLAAESLSNSWAVNASTFTLRRIGNLVQINGYFTKTSATNDAVYTFPVGFRPGTEINAVGAANFSDDFCYYYVGTGGGLTISRTSLTGSVAYLSVTYMTANAWPASLPGSAA